MRTTSTLLLLLVSASMSFPAFAQRVSVISNGWKASELTLKQLGAANIRLSRGLYHPQVRFIPAAGPRHRKGLSPQALKQITNRTMQTSLKQWHERRLSFLTATLDRQFSNNALAAELAKRESNGLHIHSGHVAATQLRANWKRTPISAISEKELYNWGSSLAKAHKMETDVKVIREGQKIILTAGPQKAVVYYRAATPGETTIRPEDILVHANGLKRQVESIDPFRQLDLWHGSPREAAEFFYLKERFLNSYNIFQATQTARKQLIAASTIPQFLALPKEKRARLETNYLTAAAYLAEDMAKLLQFISQTMPDSPVMAAYEEFVNKKHSFVYPNVFPDLWKTPLNGI